jgi:GH24 family phage-related lysozyme (muramidase)
MADGAINQQASLLLRNYEGLELNAYPDPATKAEPYTIGIGATYYPPGFRLAGRPGNKVELGDTITEAEAYEIKRYHVNQFASSAESKIGSGTWNKLPAGVKVALISKAFNYGEVYDSAIPLIESGADTGDFSDLAGYFSNRLAKHNNGINSWRRNDEASVILTNSSPRANLAFGGGSGMVRPKQSIAKLTKIPVRNSSMPSDSKSFAIDEKIKSNGAMELPIVINNVQENIARFSITTLTLNNNRMPVNQVLSRL